MTDLDVIKKFLYRVRVQDDHDSLRTMESWCWENFGPYFGECDFYGCEWDFDRWCHESGIDAELDRITVECGTEEERHAAANSYLDSIEPPFGEHCHFGSWASKYRRKTAYDYGINDFLFKDHTHATMFKRKFGTIYDTNRK